MSTSEVPHIPVLLKPLLEVVAPVKGVWLDGTFGAGGYARALLEAGATRLIGVDRDPDALARAAEWAGSYRTRLSLHEGRFGALDTIARGAGVEGLDGIVLDIGVSSMQIDEADRGFSFMQDGPLDMRMEQAGRSAADIVNTATESDLADILFQLGAERASRRIARSIVRARGEADIQTTRELAHIIERALPRAKPGQAHPATRSFQALRIAVNDELGELVRGLVAAEAMLSPGGFLAVVTFHSLEDRIVKRFMQARSGKTPGASRYMPQAPAEEPAFQTVTRKAIVADDEELAANPRARSAKLRVARRLKAPAGVASAGELGVPPVVLEEGGRSR